MAKHSILVLIRGKVGNMVGQSNSLSNGKDKQVWRAYNGTVANPKTNKQAQQRSLFVAAKNFQTAFAGILDHSWQGIDYGPKSLNFFRKLILTAGGANYPTFAYQAKGTMTPIPQPWPVSKGSINVQGFDNLILNSSRKEIQINGGSDYLLKKTMAESIPGLKIGDQITMVGIKANKAITTNGTPLSQTDILSNEYIPVVGRFIVDDTSVADFGATFAFTDENGVNIGYSLDLTDAGSLRILKGTGTSLGSNDIDLAAVALIVSRKVEGKASWQRSTAVMYVPDFITEAFNSPAYVQSCIASFQDAAGNQESDWYLNEPTDDNATADPGYIKAATLQTEGKTPETLTNAAITVSNFGKYFAGCILYDIITRKYYLFTSPNTLALSATALSQQAITDGVDGYNWLNVDIHVYVELSRLGYVITEK